MSIREEYRDCPLIYLGTAGWKYEDWVGSFYPSKKHQFTYFSKIFNTAEINSTFYNFPSRKVVESWSRAPEEFLFTAKVPQDITHKLRLKVSKGADQRMQEYLQLMSPLRDAQRLGPLLIQLPPSFDNEEYEVLDAFLQTLPKEWEFAVEFRHLSWMIDDTFSLLRRHQVAYCIVDEPLLPPRIEVTAPFAYIRWHGHGKKLWYYYLYNQEELESWVPKIRETETKTPKNIYGYFNNHWHGFAARNCVEMMELLGMPHRMPKHVRDRVNRVTDERIKSKPAQQTSLTEFSKD
ncbi:MAG: DUF72 domain-containing protein [Candidatus Hermodarchaeia archaeon]|jgi:uncharacterized protein YecE (DUF72 family)